MKKEEVYKEDFSEAEEIIESEGFDKIWHIEFKNKVYKYEIWSAIICCVVTLASYLVGGSVGFGFLGFGMSIALGIGAEFVYMKMKKTKFNFRHIVFDLVGGFGGIILTAICNELFK